MVRLNKTEAIKQANACHYLVPISLHVRKIMKSKVIVQLVPLTIIVLFSSGFALNSTIEESIFSIFRKIGVLPTRTSGGDTISQRSFPRYICGVSGWKRVVSVDASSGKCPSNFKLDSIGSGIKICRGDIPTPALDGALTYKVNFSINSSVSFTKVTGFVEGYQYGSPGAFAPAYTRNGIEGIILSYGNFTNEDLLWAYVAGLADNITHHREAHCPCSTVPGDAAPSEFSSFHYCDTGNYGNTIPNVWYTEKVLWSGEGCPATSNCCNNARLPYFCRTDLDSQKTRNADRFGIMLRLSDGNPLFKENIGITKLEIYVA